MLRAARTGEIPVQNHLKTGFLKRAFDRGVCKIAGKLQRIMKKILVFFLLVVFASSSYAQKGKNEALEAIGGSGGMLLYNTYLVIGMAADGFSKEVYTAEEAVKIVQEQLNSSEIIHQQYEALLKSGFLSDPADAEYLDELSDVFGLVRQEGEALLKYIESGQDADAIEYDTRRNQAWSEISSLLGFEE